MVILKSTMRLNYLIFLILLHLSTFLLISEAKRTWLVTGATGRTGALTYNLLKNDSSVRVRALVRNASKAQSKLDCGACSETEGVFVGDITKPSTMEAAFRGINGLVVLTSASPQGSFPHYRYPKNGTPKLVDYYGVINQVQLALKNRCDHIILVSTMGTTVPDNFLDKLGGGHISFYKLLSEAFLMSVRSPYTIIKPTGLVDKPYVAKGLQVGHNDVLPNGRIHTVTRTQVAMVVYKAAKMPKQSKYTRFDLASDPKAPLETDYSKLFNQAAKVCRDLPLTNQYDLTKTTEHELQGFRITA